MPFESFLIILVVATAQALIGHLRDIKKQKAKDAQWRKDDTMRNAHYTKIRNAEIAAERASEDASKARYAKTYWEKERISELNYHYKSAGIL